MDDQGFLPDSIVAGETIWISAANTTQDTNADIIFTDYTPAEGYTLAYDFAAVSPITVAGVANGAETGWTIEVTAAQTLVWKAGIIRFAGYVTLTTRKFAVDAGSILVTASPLATSDWTAVITACDAAILAYAGNPYGSINIGEQSISFRSMDDLINLRTFAKQNKAMETGARPKRIIRARFT